jgi:hypothetical protein
MDERGISWQVAAVALSVVAVSLVGIGYSGVLEKIQNNKEAAERHRAALGHEGMLLEMTTRNSQLRSEHIDAVNAIKMELAGINDKLERIRDKQQENTSLLGELIRNYAEVTKMAHRH